MLKSYNVGRVFGSEVRIHSLFVLLIAGMTLAVYGRDGTSAAIWQALTMVAVFGSVLLHEYGHALAARAYGIRTPQIILYPFGGIAFLDRDPNSRLAQIVVAFAGPLVNIVIAVALIWLGYWKEGQVEANTVDGMMEFLIFANVGLALFNMIPAYPMDGGRVLHALIQLALPRWKALNVSVAIGQIIAVLFIAYAVYGVALDLQSGEVPGFPMMLVIGMFIFVAAAAQAGKHPFWLLGVGGKRANYETI